MQERRIRIVLGKLGVDDHRRGLQVVSKALRDAGMEVIELGLYQTPELVVDAAIAEDADAIGLSFHTMSYIGWVGDVLRLLKEKEAAHILLFVGGAIPEADVPVLQAEGVTGVFSPGSLLVDIVNQIEKAVRQSRQQERAVFRSGQKRAAS